MKNRELQSIVDENNVLNSTRNTQLIDPKKQQIIDKINQLDDSVKNKYGSLKYEVNLDKLEGMMDKRNSGSTEPVGSIGESKYNE